MCNTPKMLFIRSKTNVKHRVFVPCGKCDDCMNNKRAESVLRIRQEYKDTIYNHGSVWFVTLHYTDQNLVYYKKGFRLTNQFFDLLRKRAQSGKLFNYRSFLLKKQHFQQFILNCHSEVKKINPKLLVRYYGVGEYGTLQQRPHYHVVLFMPYICHKKYMSDFIKKTWHYGDFDIFTFSIASAVYIAKHNIKEEIGSKLQQKKAPIFRLMSNYKGSIGRGLFTDKHLINNFNNDVNYTIVGNYKISIPRFFIKHHNRLNGKETLNDFELLEFERQSLNRLYLEFYYSFGTFYDDKNLLLNDFYIYLQTNIVKDNQKKIQFHKQYFQKKLLNFIRKTNSKFNNFNFNIYNGKSI